MVVVVQLKVEQSRWVVEQKMLVALQGDGEDQGGHDPDDYLDDYPGDYLDDYLDDYQDDYLDDYQDDCPSALALEAF